MPVTGSVRGGGSVSFRVASLSRFYWPHPPPDVVRRWIPTWRSHEDKSAECPPLMPQTCVLSWWRIQSPAKACSAAVKHCR